MKQLYESAKKGNPLSFALLLIITLFFISVLGICFSLLIYTKRRSLLEARGLSCCRHRQLGWCGRFHGPHLIRDSRGRESNLLCRHRRSQLRSLPRITRHCSFRSCEVCLERRRCTSDTPPQSCWSSGAGSEAHAGSDLGYDFVGYL